MPEKMSFGRRKAVAELLGTEEHYLQDLKNLLEGYRLRMDSANVRGCAGGLPRCQSPIQAALLLHYDIA